MTSPFKPFQEPLRVTLLRTGAIAIVVGGVIAGFSGGLTRWPFLTLLVLWVSLGGHWVEVWFLNWLRPRLAVARVIQVGARLAVWFVGGIVLMLCMELTATALGSLRTHWPAWWFVGVAFIAVELIAHLALRLGRRPNFYDGRG
jgi:hypothetical protein